MTGKERILTVLGGGVPDSVPMFLLIDPYEQRWKDKDASFAPLLKFIEKNCEIFHWWRPDSWGIFHSATDEAKRKIYEIDKGGETTIVTEIETPRGILSSAVRRSGGTYWQVKYMVEAMDDVEKIFSVPYVPLRPAVDSYAAAKDRIGNGGVVLMSCDTPLSWVAPLFDRSKFPLWVLEEKETIIKLLDLYCERTCDYARWILSHGLEGVFFGVGPEYAAPPMFSPGVFRELCSEFDKPIVDIIHQYGQKIILHCDGPIAKVMDAMVSIGADAWHPVEEPPMGDITVAEVKAKAPVCVVAGFNIAHLMTCRSDEIRAKVKRLLDTGGPGGRMMLSVNSEPYMESISTQIFENYVALVEACLEYGGY